jgi:hypothetical protein
MNYAEFAQLPASEKVVLCVVQAKTQFKVFTEYGVDLYFKMVPHFVGAIHVDGVALTEISYDDGDPAPGQYSFNPKIGRINVHCPGSIDPKTSTFVVTYKFFYANAPYILPYDLNDGEPVEFDARIESIGSLGQQLDDENTGIVLESSSNIALQNNDGFFDDIFDTLIWENQTIEFYSWSPKIPVNQAVKLFSGVIESKSFNNDKITFNVKDFVYRLKNQVNLGTFTDVDGKIAPSILNTPKRRIYGKVKQAKCVGIDAVLDGYELTGTITVSEGSTALSGSGTSFLSELSPQDEIYIELDDGTIEKIAVESITSDTAAVLGDESDVSITNASVIVKPKIPYRQKNRRWHIAGHPLVTPVSTIVFPTTARRFIVDTTDDFFADDSVEINGNPVKIVRISGSNIIIDQSIDPLPDIGNTIDKSPITKVYFGSKELLPERDWTLTNFPEAIIEINPLAEFNIANARNISNINLTFTNASRSVTTTATIDLRTLLKPRDWIRKNSITETTWFEVLDVQQQTITLRTAFTGTTQTTTGKMKNVELIDDDSLITVDCIGKRNESFGWIRTASDVVRDLIKNDAGFSEIDEDSFSQADSDCNWTISMVIPETIGEKSPTVRDVITKINESVFGSLYGNQTQEIAYSILNSRKPTSLSVIQDHDILSWNSSTEQKIVNKVKINYRPFVDIFTGSDGFESVEFQSDFVDKFIGIQNTDERTVYLYDEEKATIMAQRIAFYKSLSNCKITLKGKLNLALITVNDKMYIEFDRLFKRYGGSDNKKIAIVTGVKKDGMNVDVEMTDLGNIFNRVPSIAPNTTPSYSTATRDDAVKYGFILDNDTLTPDNTSEMDLGNNRIG